MNNDMMIMINGQKMPVRKVKHWSFAPAGSSPTEATRNIITKCGTDTFYHRINLMQPVGDHATHVGGFGGTRRRGQAAWSLADGDAGFAALRGHERLAVVVGRQFLHQVPRVGESRMRGVAGEDIRLRREKR